MTPPKNGNLPVTVDLCRRKHNVTTWLLGIVIVVGLALCRFAWSAGDGANKAAGAVETMKVHVEHVRESQNRLEEQISEIRKTQMVIVRNEKGGE